MTVPGETDGIRAAVRRVLEEMDEEQRQGRENRLRDGESLGRLMTDRAVKVARRVREQGSPITGDAELELLVRAVLPMQNGSTPVYARTEHAVERFRRLRPAVAQGIAPAVVAAWGRWASEADVDRLVEHVIETHHVLAAMTEMPASRRARPEVVAVAAIAVRRHRGSPQQRAAYALELLSAAAQLAARLRWQSTNAPAGPAMPVLGDRGFLLDAACLEHVVAGGGDADADVERRHLELARALRTALDSTADDNADYLRFVHTQIKRLTECAARPEDASLIKQAVLCFCRWLSEDRLVTDRERRTTPVENGELDRRPGRPAHDRWETAEDLLTSMAGVMLGHADPSHRPLVTGWLAEELPDLSGAQLLVLLPLLHAALRHLTNQHAAPAAPHDLGAIRPALSARARKVAALVTPSGQGYDGLAHLLPAMWTSRLDAVKRVYQHLLDTGARGTAALVRAHAGVCGPAQYVLARNDADTVVTDRPWSEPGPVDSYATIAAAGSARPDAVRMAVTRALADGWPIRIL